MRNLRRLPADETGRQGLCEPNGHIAAMADLAEEATLVTADRDIKQVKELLERHTEATRAVLVHSLSFLVQSAEATLEVAHLRGERLEKYEEASED